MRDRDRVESGYDDHRKVEDFLATSPDGVAAVRPDVRYVTSPGRHLSSGGGSRPGGGQEPTSLDRELDVLEARPRVAADADGPDQQPGLGCDE